MTRMSAEFADTNVVLYLLDNGPKADRAETILGQGPRISVQVLNETLVNCRRKAGLSWEEAAAFLEGVRALCPVEDLTIQTHDVGRALVAALVSTGLQPQDLVQAASMARFPAESGGQEGDRAFDGGFGTDDP